MKLCVVTATLGEPSETFVKRHIELISEEPVCVIARNVHASNTIAIESRKLLVLSDIDKLTPLGGYRMLLKSLFLLRPNFLLTRKHNRAICDFLDENEIDVILLEFLDASLPFLKLLESREILKIAHGHGSDVSSRLRHWWWRRAYKSYRDIPVVVVSNRSKIRLNNLCNIKLEFLHVIPCSPKFESIRGQAIRAKRLDGNTVRVLTIGRLVSKKDPLGLIEVMKIAYHDLKLDVHLTIVGVGPLLETLKSRIVECGLEDRITLAGVVENEIVIEMLMDSDIYVQNSRIDPVTGEEEGLPVSILEAMGAGLPIIATSHAGIPEVIKNQVSGILVPECSYFEMANAIRNLIKNPELATTYGIQARNVVENELNWDRERQNLIALFESRQSQNMSLKGRNDN